MTFVIEFDLFVKGFIQFDCLMEFGDFIIGIWTLYTSRFMKYLVFQENTLSIYM